MYIYIVSPWASRYRVRNKDSRNYHLTEKNRQSNVSIFIRVLIIQSVHPSVFPNNFQGEEMSFCISKIYFGIIKSAF